MNLVFTDGRTAHHILGHRTGSRQPFSTSTDLQKSTEHPAMKPVDLIEYQILNNTKGQDLVLDLFDDSGGIFAAEKSGRHCVGSELDPKYCDVIVRRWQKFTMKDAALQGSNRTFNDVAQQKDSGNGGQFLQRISEGRSQSSVCRDEDMRIGLPYGKWTKTDPDFARQFAEAKEQRGNYYGERGR